MCKRSILLALAACAPQASDTAQGAGNGDTGQPAWQAPDNDGDGYGEDEDCDDDDPEIHPGQDEAPYDGIDNDCDPDTPDDDLDQDGALLADDCDDGDPEIHPEATELCDDGIDNDCDGQIDDWQAECRPIAGFAAAFLTGEAVGDEAGVELSASPDLTGDGQADIVVGAWGNDTKGDWAGATYIFSGDVQGEHSLPEATAIIYGTGDEMAAGHGVLGAGDLTGDGHNDVLIAAWPDTTGDSFVGGYLMAGPFTGEHSVAEAHTTWRDVLTFEFSSADANGDGQADLLISNRSDDTGAQNAGAVHLHYGPIHTLGDLSGADVSVFGDGEQDRLGLHVLAGEDTNGDGVADLLLGTIGTDDNGEYETGSLFVFEGPVSGTYSARDADTTVVGSANYKAVARDFGFVGDVTGDGQPDFALTGGGAAHLLDLEATGTQTIDDISPARVEGHAWRVEGLGDANSDGFEDMAISSPGTTVVVLGPISGTVSATTADGAHYLDDDGAAGWELAALPRPDAPHRLLVGAPNHDDERGGVYVLDAPFE